ncbi:hypothetical protein ACS0TY_004117 [Phlomoides rotata]
MESVGSNNIEVSKEGKKCERNRRCWSAMEEGVLIQVLKELVTKGWKYGNGFRPGYLMKLEAELIQKLPATDLRSTPHINSKITMWKKQHRSLVKILLEIGVGFNHTTKLIDCNNDAWAKVVKKYPNAVNLRHKAWSYLDDWNEIFGKDCVTGGEKKANSSGKKRAAAVDGSENDELCELLRQMTRSSEIIVGAIGYTTDLGKTRKEVISMLGEMPDISMDEKLDAYHMLAKNTGRLDMFLGFPEHVRARYVRRLLAGDFEKLG